MYCERNKHYYHYVSAAHIICDGPHADTIRPCRSKNNLSHCTEEVLKYCKLDGSHFMYPFIGGIRPLRSYQICATPDWLPVCSDGLDQINCSESTRVALKCSIDSFPSTISRFAICKNHSLCDDHYENKCLEAEGGCLIHKNQLCDNYFDCPGKGDEKFSICEFLSNVTCQRRVSLLSLIHI